jgi:two-component system, NarL family, response regulator NreC
MLLETEEQTKQWRIYLVDDHAVVRDGLRTMINHEKDMRVVGEADNGRTAVEQIGILQPHVVLADVSMPGWNGIETATRIHSRWPAIKILTLTMHEDRAYLRSLLEVGVSGYVSKRSVADEVIRAIRSVARGETYIDPVMTASVLQSFLTKSGPRSLKGEISGQPLSDRETEVLRLVAQGYTNKEIGVKLLVSEKTIETYKMRAMKKLDMDSRVDVIRFALSQGWLQEN